MTFKIIIALTLGVYPLLGAGASITSNKKKNDTDIATSSLTHEMLL